MAPNDYGPSILATAFSLTTVSTCIVSLRLFCNIRLIKRAGVADVFMLTALILTWGITVTNYYQVKYGTGQHIYAIHGGPEVLKGTLKSWYSFQIAYLVDLLCVKLSILTFYCAICDQKWFRLTIYSIMGIVSGFTIAMTFVNAFECPNPSDAFTVEIVMAGKGSCRDLHSMYFTQAGFNIVSDMVIMFLPIPLLARLQMPRARRLALFAIFSVGFIAVLASILRLWTLTLWARSKDVPYSGGPILIWTQIELNAAIISASFPALKALFAHTFSMGSRASKSNSSRYYKYSYGANSGGRASSGKVVKDSAITLKTLSLIKPGESRTSTTLPRGGHGIRSSNDSEEMIFLDDPAGEETVIESGRASSEGRDRSGSLRTPPAVYPKHNGIMKSTTVEQRTEMGTASQQYYRAHFIR